MTLSKTILQRPLTTEALTFSDDVSPLLQRIYAARGINSNHELDLSLAKLISFHALKNIQAAVALLYQSLSQQQRILIIGDFDADGATSTALAVLALKKLGAQQVNYLVPNRFEYGYGLTPEIVEVAKTRHPDLIITVDNGISSIEGVKVARQAGIQVLVTDHHLPGNTLPEANAIINPNLADCEFPCKNLSGVGVIFYLMTALRSHCREQGWFQQQGLAEPALHQFLDLVALGTTADLVPLDYNNRILVQQGIKRIRAGNTRPGILALLEVANRDYDNLVASDLGYAIAPRLNAAGRLDDMSLGIECLLCEDFQQAKTIAIQLECLNLDRRSIESGMQQQAKQLLEELKLEEKNLPWGLSLFNENWHQGVIGILASRVKDQYHRPTIVFAPGNEQELKGSARSITGFHIRDALDTIATANPGLINKFGGHAMAAGLSLPKENFHRFAQLFDELVKKQITAEVLQHTLMTDGELSVDELTLDVAELLKSAGPWGQHFPEPIFEGKFKVVSQRTVADKHLKLVLNKVGCDLVVEAIAFNYKPEIDLARQRIHAAYKLDINDFNGRKTLQLIIEHLQHDFNDYKE